MSRGNETALTLFKYENDIDINNDKDVYHFLKILNKSIKTLKDDDLDIKIKSFYKKVYEQCKIKLQNDKIIRNKLLVYQLIISGIISENGLKMTEIIKNLNLEKNDNFKFLNQLVTLMQNINLLNLNEEINETLKILNEFKIELLNSDDVYLFNKIDRMCELFFISLISSACLDKNRFNIEYIKMYDGISTINKFVSSAENKIFFSEILSLEIKMLLEQPVQVINFLNKKMLIDLLKDLKLKLEENR